MNNKNNPYKHQKFSPKSGISVMNIVLILVGISLLAFTIAMIQIFREYGSIPDTLITCVFATLGGECGVMGWIKTTKEKNQDLKKQLEDREYNEKKQAGMEEKFNE